MHQLINLKNIGLSFAHKTCFEGFSAQIYHGSKIAIIGRNGSGKSTLLKFFTEQLKPTSGSIEIAKDVSIGYVPQVITDHNDLSGGQRFNKKLTEILSEDPDVLLLDEPTNHLDEKNRRSLMRMLTRCEGTLIVVTHDREILRCCINTIWHINNSKISRFSGNYDDYIRQIGLTKSSLEQSVAQLNKQKKQAQLAQSKEQKRMAKSIAQGKKKIAQKKWMPSVGSAYASQAQKSSGKKQSALSEKKQAISSKLSDLYRPEEIMPTFSLQADTIGSSTLISVREGSVGYSQDSQIVKNINFSLLSGQRIAITGDNGSGKSTLIKAFLHNDSVFTSGQWHMPKLSEIGYLDQHYSTLDSDLSVLQILQGTVSDWPVAQVRKHLNDFLFRKNEEVEALASTLSGGEKARLALAVIAAKTPKLLILDEMTNNLDLETKEHVEQVLREYPGTLIVISHDASFLENISIQDYYRVTKGKFHYLEVY